MVLRCLLRDWFYPPSCFWFLSYPVCVPVSSRLAHSFLSDFLQLTPFLHHSLHFYSYVFLLLSPVLYAAVYFVRLSKPSSLSICLGRFSCHTERTGPSFPHLWHPVYVSHAEAVTPWQSWQSLCIFIIDNVGRGPAMQCWVINMKGDLENCFLKRLKSQVLLTGKTTIFLHSHHR